MNMKKVILSCFSFLIVVMLVGCNNTIVDEETSSIEKGEIIQTADEEKSNNVNVTESDIGDLLYREYQSGENFFAGVALIKKSDVLSLVSSPVKIMVLYNGKLVNEIDFTNADMTIEISEDGNYCFLAADEQNEITDITSIATGEAVISEGSEVIPLNW